MSIHINPTNVTPHPPSQGKPAGRQASSFDSVLNVALVGMLSHAHYQPLSKQILVFLLQAVRAQLGQRTPHAFPASATNDHARHAVHTKAAGHEEASKTGQMRETAPRETPTEEKVPFAGIIRRAAKTYGIDAKLIEAVIRVESNFNPRAVSRAGAKGLMQLMPETAKDLQVTDPFDPEQNIMAGSRYLKLLLQRYHGNVELALASYNWGMGNLERRPEQMPSETKHYVMKVISLIGKNPEV